MHLRYALLTLICILLSFPVSAEFYRYTDKNGVVCFTDNLADIPEDQRLDVHRYSEPEDYLTPEERDKKARQEAEDRQVAQEASGASDKRKETEIREAKNRSPAGGLNKTKAALDKEYAELVKEKESLAKEKDTSATSAGDKAYQEKVTRLNERITGYDKRRKAFQEEADAFNAATGE
jgi:hypothetical protein